MLPPNSRILTTCGWVMVPRVKPGDFVLSVDAAGVCAPARIADVLLKQHTGELIHGDSMLFTVNNRFVLRGEQLVCYTDRPSNSSEYRVAPDRWVGRRPTRAKLARFVGTVASRRLGIDCLPQWVLGASGRWQQWVLHAILRDQGHKSRIWVSREVMHDQVVEMALKAGYSVDVREWAIRLRTRRWRKFGTHLRHRSYHGFVYGLVVRNFFVWQEEQVWLSGGEE
jgi:hypothetical protein